MDIQGVVLTMCRVKTRKNQFWLRRHGNNRDVMMANV